MALCIDREKKEDIFESHAESKRSIARARNILYLNVSVALKIYLK